MPTLRQMVANRLNAQHSTGPLSVAGKLRASRNALRHGLAAEALTLPEDAELVATRVAELTERFNPEGDEEVRLVETAALDSVRLERCQLEEIALLDDQAHRAQFFWDEDRQLDAAQLGKRLSKSPECTTLELERTPQGCALKVERWEALLQALGNGDEWDDAHRSIALDLLGVLPVFRERGLTEIDPEPEYEGSSSSWQASLAGVERDRLVERRESWLDDYDEVVRQKTAEGVAFPIREVWLVRRYEAACTRRMDAALKALRERTASRGPARPRPVPVVVARTEVVEETPAPVAAPVSPRVELASAVAPESKDVAAVPTSRPNPFSTPAPSGNRRHRKAMAALARKRAKNSV